MNNHEILSALSKEQLIELLGVSAKTWLALGCVWECRLEGATHGHA